MNFIEKTAYTLAQASDGNPIITTIVIILFYFMFAFLEGGVEKLMLGERFDHWLDPFFQCAFIAYSAYAVFACAVFNTNK